MTSETLKSLDRCVELRALRAAEREAKANLVARAQAVLERVQAQAEAAIAADESATMENAPATRHERIGAEAQGDAAARQLRSAQAEYDRSTAALAQATDLARLAVMKHIDAEARQAQEDFRRLDAERNAVRERLLGLYLVRQTALSDREWLELERGGSLSTVDMKIGLPMVALSWTEAMPDGRTARLRVDSAAQGWRDRIASLERGDFKLPADSQAA